MLTNAQFSPSKLLLVIQGLLFMERQSALAGTTALPAFETTVPKMKSAEHMKESHAITRIVSILSSDVLCYTLDLLLRVPAVVKLTSLLCGTFYMYEMGNPCGLG